MSGKQIGVILIVFIAMETAVDGVAGLGFLPRTFARGPFSHGEIVDMFVLAAVVTLPIVLLPALVLIGARSWIAGRWFDVGEGRLTSGVTFEQLLLVVCWFIGLNSIINGLYAAVASVQMSLFADWTPLEIASRITSRLLLIAAGLGLMLRAPALASWWARRAASHQ